MRRTRFIITALNLMLLVHSPLGAQSLAALARPPQPAPAQTVGAPAAQTAAALVTVEVLPAYRAGDEFRLQVTHTQGSTTRPERNSTVTSPIQVRVLSAGPNGAVLEWIPGIGKNNNPQIANDPLVRATLEAVNGLSLKLSLNADAELEGVENEAEVVSKLQRVVKVLSDALMAKVPAEGRAAVQRTLNQVLSPEVLLMSALRDPQLYFGLNGAALDVGDEVEIDVEQPTPFSATPIPAMLWVKAESATPDTFVIVTKTTYDGRAVTKIATGILEAAGAPLSAADAAIPVMELRDEGRFVYDRALGLARELTVTRVVRAGPEQRTDRFEIRMVQGPGR